MKKSKKAKVKLPFFEYTWYKEICKLETNKEFIQDQIDGLVAYIKNPNSYTSCMKNELEAFVKSIIFQGHYPKLEKEYQEKFFKIANFLKKNWSVTVDVVPLR